jgi:hypothetical protein
MHGHGTGLRCGRALYGIVCRHHGRLPTGKRSLADDHQPRRAGISYYKRERNGVRLPACDRTDVSDVYDRPHFHSDGSWAWERWQDVEPILERNKARQNAPQHNETFRHVAEIPNIFLEQWLNEEYRKGNVGLRLFTPEFDALIKRKLRDPDWRWLKATDKQI